MFTEAFQPKEAIELSIKLRANQARATKEYPKEDEWKRLQFKTKGKSEGEWKDKPIYYYILELDGIAGVGKSGRRMLAATLGNHVRTVASFETKFYNLIEDQLKAGYYNRETRELEAIVTGFINEEQCGFKYTVTLPNGQTIVRSSVKVICILEENDKAAVLIAQEIEKARATMIVDTIENADAKKDVENALNKNEEEDDDD